MDDHNRRGDSRERSHRDRERSHKPRESVRYERKYERHGDRRDNRRDGRENNTRSSYGDRRDRRPLDDARGVEQQRENKKHRHGDEQLEQDPNLRQLDDDPRSRGPLGKAQKAAMGIQGLTGRNTQSFDPASTLVRPQMRILVGRNGRTYGKPIKHDDIIIVPNFFCDEDDWSLYYKLIEEMREAQERCDKGSEWLSWHEGAHLISKNPTGSATYQMLQDRMCEYFNVKRESAGTRFNWYRDSSDWKPFHHDSAAFNQQRARNQNATIGVSLGSSRELAFIHAQDPNMKIYFPQTNGMLFYFGKDVNINWKHGVNALPAAEQDGKGRISIILWGWVRDTVDEEGSPPMLTNDSRRVYDGRRHDGRDHHRHGPRDQRERNRGDSRDPRHDRRRRDSRDERGHSPVLGDQAA